MMGEFEVKRTNGEDEIDLIALFNMFWQGRKTVLKYLVAFGLIGLFVAIFSPKEYTASTMIVPVSAEKSGVGSLGGLAAMAGINLSSGSAGASIAPSLYPKVIKSIPFKKELLETSISVVEMDKPITFRKYYEEIYSPGFLAILKKYTVGFPKLVLGWLRGDPTKVKIHQEEGKIIMLSRKEYDLMRRLDLLMHLDVNDKEGYVTLNASMPEALPAAQMAKKAQQLLQEYIIDFKSQKAIEQLKFVEERYKEKEKEFRKAEMALAHFKDRNRFVSTETAMTEEKRLSSEYNLSYSICLELAKKVEAQKIQVKEDTPVFTVIEPVSVPVEKSKPKRIMILAIWLFLGFVIGVGVVFGKKFVRNIRENRL